ncbi:MAG: MFS transporter [Candidatus Rokubacteria bacterium]|nr:MFS transporter [Candidatus Rokubacteria bacterium]
MLDRLARLNPFKTPEAQRLAILFAIVYFAQGMYELPTQTLTLTLKERLGLSAGQAATFFLIVTVPWFVKPVYGLISDFVPLFGRRRKSYFLLAAALAAGSGFALAVFGGVSYWRLAVLYTAMGLGIAFTDVLTDALMVENGRPRGLTGAFQSVQWAAIYGATILAGALGGYLAERRELAGAFAIGACFPLVSFTMALVYVRDPAAHRDREAFLATWAAIREALGSRTVWGVAGFILFWTFSPSFGPAFLYYQTDQLKFDQQFIGYLASLSAASAIAGAFIYAPLSRRIRLKWIIVASIGIGALSTLAYLLYRDRTSATVIDGSFGCVAMITQLAFLDLAAKSCPRRVEGTFFALLMSVFNLGVKGSQITGGYLYDWLGYTPLVLISAGFTALAWLLVPLVKIDRIEAQALKDVPLPDSAEPQPVRAS